MTADRHPSLVGIIELNGRYFWDVTFDELLPPTRSGKTATFDAALAAVLEAVANARAPN